ncbi:hypothetical protein, partial [Parasutterella excrementihominis]
FFFRFTTASSEGKRSPLKNDGQLSAVRALSTNSWQAELWLTAESENKQNRKSASAIRLSRQCRREEKISPAWVTGRFFKAQSKSE